MGPKIWNSLLEDVKDLTSLPKFTEFIETWYGPECRYVTSANTRVTHITILKLHTLACICPSGNLIPNINKQNIKHNAIVVIWCVYNWYVLTH